MHFSLDSALSTGALVGHAGYILLILFGRRGPIGAFLAEHLGIVFSFRWTGAALACGVMGFPLMVRAIRLSVEAVDKRLEEAAGTLGANRAWVFLTVTLPLIVPGIIAGMILCFAKAMGEFGATITFVSNIPGQTRTIPMAIYTYTQVPDGDLAAFKAERTARIPLGRRSDPEDMAAMVVWLATAAPDYMTAARLNVTGGLDQD